MTDSGSARGDALLIVALASGFTWKSAAARAHVSESTVSRRMGDPAFRQAVADARVDMVNRGVGVLSLAVADAATAIVAIVQSDTETTRLSAARTVLEQVVKLRDHIEVNERLAAVEKRLAALGGTP